MDYDDLSQMDDPMSAMVANARAEEGSAATYGNANSTGYYKPHIPYQYEDNMDDSSSTYSDPDLAAQAAIATIAYEVERSEMNEIQQGLAEIKEEVGRSRKNLMIFSAIACFAFPLGVMIEAKLARTSSLI